MKVVFYIEIGGGGNADSDITHVGSYGERTHALSLARLFRDAGHDPIFVVGPCIERHIASAGFEPKVFASPSDGMRLVKQIDPQLVIGCELFNLSPSSAKGLIEFGRPLATVDGTTIPLVINSDPFGIPALQRDLVLPSKYFSFRPCPVNDIKPNTDDAFYWPLFPRKIRRPEKDEDIYAGLGLNPSRKTVLFAAAPWAQGASMLFNFKNYYQSLIRKIATGLEASEEDVDFLFVSMHRVENSPGSNSKYVTVHQTGLMPHDYYDHILTSCDIIISDNIIQTSVSKAMVMGTPHLIIEGNGCCESAPYPYNIFPVKQLFPPEREYSQLVEKAKFCDVSEIREKLVSIVRYGHHDTGRLRRRRQYLDRLTKMPVLNEHLDKVMELKCI